MTDALWANGFRPFFLLGAIYGPVALLVWIPVWAGWVAMPSLLPLHLWHAHEMLYGFSGAFICGFLLTALPSWAGTPEIKGKKLILLVVFWSAGRVASWSYHWAGPAVIGAVDLLLFAGLAALVLPGLLTISQKRYLALLPILVGFVIANAAYHVGAWQGDSRLAELALIMALDVLVVLFSIVGGFLTPIFTESKLRERNPEATVMFSWPLETAAIATVVVLAAADWARLPAAVSGSIACLAAAAHLIRMLGWRTASIVRAPLVLAMHVGYAWLVAAMALRGMADVFNWTQRDAWVHAFTVGALGMMKLAFLNRVALRHTGRTLTISLGALAGLVLMFSAGCIRVGIGMAGAGPEWMMVSAVLWAAPFVLFLATDAPLLWRPSLPRQAPPVTPSRFEP